MTRAEGVHPRAERQHLLALVRPPEQDPRAALLSADGQLGDEPCLPDSRLADDADHPPVSPPGLGERLRQLRQLGPSADERRLHRRRGRARRRLRWARSDLGRRRRARQSLAEDVLVERLRLGLGLHAQLLLECAHALLILPERRAPPPLLGVKPHQRPVRRLLQRVQRQQFERGLHRCLCGPRLSLMRQQLRQPLQRQLPQPLPLGDEPLLEQRLVHGEAGEQVALVERGGLLQRLGRALGHQPLEGRDVDIDHGAIQGESFALEQERRRPRLAKCLANREECLAQARPRRLLPDFSPEQCCELVAGVRLAQGDREVAQQRLSLLSRQGERRARLQPGLEAAEKAKVETRHSSPSGS